LNYVHIDEDVPLITDGIVIEINRKHLEQDVTFIGFTRKVPIGYGDGLETTPGVDVLGNLWDDLHAFKDQVKERVAGPEEVGVILPCSENGFYNYFAGLRSVADDCKVQGRIDQWILPRGEYIFCTIEAENFDALVSNDLFLLKQYCFVLIHIVSN